MNGPRATFLLMLAIMPILPIAALAQTVTLTLDKTEVCADLRAALAVREAARKAWSAFEGKPPRPFDLRDKSPEARAWFARKRAHSEVYSQAHEQVRTARRGVEEAIQDKAARAVLSAVVDAMAGNAPVDRAIREWKRKVLITEWSKFDRLDSAYTSMILSHWSVYDEVLRAACRFDG